MSEVVWPQTVSRLMRLTVFAAAADEDEEEEEDDLLTRTGTFVASSDTLSSGVVQVGSHLRSRER